VTVTIDSDDRTVRVAVADVGPGIAPEHLDHLFDRFYKADPSRPRSSGSGLGLAIARENARLHGGDVTVVSASTAFGARSPAGGGTVFTVVLPRRSAPPEGDEAAPAVAPPLPTGDEAVTTGRLTAIEAPRRRRR
jgi:two-component system, OmpR family, sensor histidine kinase MtrB